MKNKTKLIYGKPGHDMNLFYATGFHTHDPILFVEHNRKKHLYLNDLEVDRGKRTARVDKVINIKKYAQAAKKRIKKTISMSDIIFEILRELKTKSIELPANSYAKLVDELRKKGIRVNIKEDPFFPERFVKTNQEKNEIIKAQKVTFRAIKLARDYLAKTKIKKNLLYLDGKALTSEWLRSKICLFLLEQGYYSTEPIVACGQHSIDPHERGSGPLKPHKSIIVDVFPQSLETHYHGDATRTFCRGKAPEPLKKMYNAVLKAQKFALSQIKAGAHGNKIHSQIIQNFEKEGYKSGMADGRYQGMFHGTGHGIGLDIHEGTRIDTSKCILKKGNITSVEPGLYYKDIGGVRIEDLVYVRKNDCEMLSSFPKQLEIL